MVKLITCATLLSLAVALTCAAPVTDNASSLLARTMKSSHKKSKKSSHKNGGSSYNGGSTYGSSGSSGHKKGSVSKNSSSAPSDSDKSNDANILNFALTLEHLESEFYKQGLEKFKASDFKSAGAADPELAFSTFQTIGQTEATHVTTLQTVIKSLGGTPVPPCEYNFDFSTIQTFIGTARALEVTGVSAYTGALALLKEAAIQTAGGTIGTVEARHSTFLNLISNGAAIPYAFDTPLSASNVVTIATPFLKKCDFDLGIKGHDALTITNDKTARGTKLTFKSKNSSTDGMFCNFLFAEKSISVPASSCEVPKEANGHVYVVLTNSDKGIVSLGDESSIVSGPALFFVDDGGSSSSGSSSSGSSSSGSSGPPPNFRDDPVLGWVSS